MLNGEKKNGSEKENIYMQKIKVGLLPYTTHKNELQMD